MIRIALEEDRKWRSQQERKKIKWVHKVWEVRTVEGEIFLLLPHLMDDDTKF